jgi:hypothetical protein
MGGSLRAARDERPSKDPRGRAPRRSVIGVVLEAQDDSFTKLYLSGATVWHERGREMAARLKHRQRWLTAGLPMEA